MGTRWGINRTVAQIHALLYLSPRPLPAEEIASLLSVARSNVSTSLRELQGWDLVRLVHVMGDRRDHFETQSDVWQMFLHVLDERKKREVDPTIRMLHECMADLKREKQPDPLLQSRLSAMLDFFQTTTGWYEQLRRLPQDALIKVMKLGDRVRSLLPGSRSR